MTILFFLLACQDPPTELCQGPEESCEVASGDYLVLVPSAWDGATPMPVVLHFHGHNSSPEAFIGNGESDAHDREGVLLVLPRGQDDTWTVMNDGLGGSGRDDVAFVGEVVADLRARFPVDEARIYLSGHSQGAAMASTLACKGLEGVDFAAAAPTSGGLWEPLPECTDPPIPICRVHGTEDEMWTWEGRQVEEDGGSWMQAGVEEDVAMWRDHNGCAQEAADLEMEVGELTCQYWTSCEAEVGLCTYEGGHRIVPDWSERHLEWMLRFSR